MIIHTTIKDLREKYNFDAPSLLDKFFEECPVVEKLFPKRYERGHQIKYKIRYADPKLRELMRQVDLFKNRLNGNSEDYDSLTAAYISSFREMAHKSMSKKKDIDVVWFE